VLRNDIPADLRPVLIERVRQLNAQGMYDTEIGENLGYSVWTIRRLRVQGDIPRLVSSSSNTNRRKAPTVDATCPTCGQSIDVRRGVVLPHNAFLGATGPGTIHGHTVQIAEPCPGVGQPHAAAALEAAGELVAT
jgi:hypothetical protein